jgi:signal peptidase II
MSKGTKAILIVLLVLIADQALKIWIKTNFALHDSIRITDWFYIYFIENNGMAFGMEIFNKLFLTLFRIAAVGAIGYYVWLLTHRNANMGFIACVALIFAGALGNIIDSVFYGVIFDQSNGQIAQLFPAGGGYAGWFHGRVVDMFYFPLFTFPGWLPFLGGEVFFSPVFNIADSAISVGAVLILLFYHKNFIKEEKKIVED